MSASTRLITVTLAAVMMSLAGCQGASTPEAAFENVKSALKNKDYKSAFVQLTPDTQDMILGGMAMALRAISGLDPATGPELEKIAQRHGLKKVEITMTPQTAWKQAVADVKDKPACFAEMIEWAVKNRRNDPTYNSRMNDIAAAMLSDLKIEGDRASGTIKWKKGDQEISDRIKFQRIGGAWYIDLLPPILKSDSPTKT